MEKGQLFYTESWGKGNPHKNLGKTWKNRITFPYRIREKKGTPCESRIKRVK
jgi:hypothetical protein